MRYNLGDEVEEGPHSVLEEELVGVVERDAGREVALHGAALQAARVGTQFKSKILS